MLNILAIYALAFALKEIEGPFGILSLFRMALFRLPYLGVFFIKLFDCYFCLGTHAGWIVYLISPEPFRAGSAVLWGLTGAISSLILSQLHQLLETKLNA